jgi:hypothetical protein
MKLDTSVVGSRGSRVDRVAMERERTSDPSPPLPAPSAYLTPKATHYCTLTVAIYLLSVLQFSYITLSFAQVESDRPAAPTLTQLTGTSWSTHFLHSHTSNMIRTERLDNLNNAL